MDEKSFNYGEIGQDLQTVKHIKTKTQHKKFYKAKLLEIHF